jgi:hypothetical protein
MVNALIDSVADGQFGCGIKQADGCCSFAESVLVQREMEFCRIGVNRKWVTVTNLF